MAGESRRDVGPGAKIWAWIVDEWANCAGPCAHQPWGPYPVSAGVPSEADAPIRTADPFLTRVDPRWQPVPQVPQVPAAKPRSLTRKDSKESTDTSRCAAGVRSLAIVRRRTRSPLGILWRSWPSTAGLGKSRWSTCRVITSARGCGVSGCLTDLWPQEECATSAARTERSPRSRFRRQLRPPGTPRHTRTRRSPRDA
jgi:hypothetical protein